MAGCNPMKGTKRSRRNWYRPIGGSRMISGRLRRRFTVTLSMVVVLFLLSALGVNQVLADDPVWLTVVGQWEYYDRDDTWVPAKTFNVKLEVGWN